MSEATVKISGWKPQGKPDNEDELSFYRKLVVEAVYGLSFAKKQAFGMDCSVSLEEIFTEVEHKLFYLEMCRALKYAKRGKRYVDRRVNECFEEDTLVQTSDGLERIEDLQPGDFIVGLSHGLSDGAKVLAHHEIRREGKLVELTLANHEKLVCTPDHLCLTGDGWIEASQITYKSFLGCGRRSATSSSMATARQGRIDESISKSYLDRNQITCQKDGTKTHNPVGSILCLGVEENGSQSQLDRDGQGIFGRNCRWRRFNINYAMLRHPKEERFSMRSQTLHQQYINRLGRLALRETSRLALDKGQAETKSEMEDCLCLPNSGLQHSTSYSGYFALSGDKKETRNSAPTVFRASETPSWKGLFEGRNRHSRADPKYESTRVLAKRFLSFKGIVHDLTTTTGNYIANGIIVHNCACPKFYGDGVPKIVAATAGFYVVNTKRLSVVQEILNK